MPSTVLAVEVNPKRVSIRRNASNTAPNFKGASHASNSIYRRSRAGQLGMSVP